MGDDDTEFERPERYGRSPTDKAWRLREACLEHIIELRDQQGGYARTIVRAVFYVLVVLRVVPKSYEGRKRTPAQDVADALTWLRQQGWVDWGEIVDESRTVSDFTGYPTIADGVRAVLDHLRLDPWNGDPPVIVVESRSLWSLVTDIALTFRVPLVPLGGQASGSHLHNKVADLLGPTTVVFFVGDYDKPGDDIERSARRRLQRFAPRWGARGFWRRLAVTDEQAEELRDLWIRKQDQRNGQWYGTLEAEGLGVVRLRQIVTDALSALLRERGVDLDDLRAEEERQRDDIRRLLDDAYGPAEE
jgi:hypothetical protein